MDGKWIPGVSRQDLKKIKELPVPLFREWLINYSNEIQYQGAVAEKALILEALHREFGFGKVRIGRVLARAVKIKEEVEHGQGKNSEDRSK
nr:MAG TPA: hypothetical protein [Caudoviricetes sp.]